MLYELSDFVNYVKPGARIASVGCSSGEEVYSVLSVLNYHGINDYHICGYDYDPVAVSGFRSGKFTYIGKYDEVDNIKKNDPNPESVDNFLALYSSISGYIGVAGERLYYMKPEYLKDHFDHKTDIFLHDITKEPIPESDIIFCRYVAVHYSRQVGLLESLWNNLMNSLAGDGILIIDKKSANYFQKLLNINIESMKCRESLTGVILKKESSLQHNKDSADHACCSGHEQ